MPIVQKNSQSKQALRLDLKPWTSIVLQHLPKQILKRLKYIFAASLKLRKVPPQWCISNVIFLPKPGKDDYSVPKAFRPISLTSFVFKAMEKVIYKNLVFTTLSEYPMHDNQHAFRSKHSCDTALSDFIHRVEQPVMTQGFAMAGFLDIAGAFDNVSLEATDIAMREHNFDDDVREWYNYYLSHRVIHTDIQGTSTKKKLMKGTPQGGILSPIIWNLIFDSLLRLFDNNQDVHAIGFADDCVLVTTGDDLVVMKRNLQRAIDDALEWGNQKRLNFSASKSGIMVFSRKKNIREPPPLKMNGNNID